MHITENFQPDWWFSRWRALLKFHLIKMQPEDDWIYDIVRRFFISEISRCSYNKKKTWCSQISSTINPTSSRNPGCSSRSEFFRLAPAAARTLTFRDALGSFIWVKVFRRYLRLDCRFVHREKWCRYPRAVCIQTSVPLNRANPTTLRLLLTDNNRSSVVYVSNDYRGFCFCLTCHAR